ncbi:MAG: CpaF family protein [Acidimicrobiia bacterium]
MSDVDRLVASLLESSTPLERAELTHAGHHLVEDLAPLASPDTVERAVHAIVGLGPLEEPLADPDVTDVLVNGPEEVWIEIKGELVRTNITFRDAEDIVAMVRRAIAPLGLRIDRAEPAVDARLHDGSRLHAVIPPAAVDSPIVAIRRFHPAVSSLDDLVEQGSVDTDIAAQLREAVDTRRNLLIAGATGAGKTTLLNVLSAEIPPTQRVVTIEEAAELRIAGHVVRLESRRANVEGVGDITIRQLLRHALRLRPDRIVVGEVRGPEALDMLQALNTGHAGSMSTIHANGSREALVRLATLAAMAPEAVPPLALSDLVDGAIDTVVLVSRVDGGRRVTEVLNVSGIERHRE